MNNEDHVSREEFTELKDKVQSIETFAVKTNRKVNIIADDFQKLLYKLKDDSTDTQLSIARQDFKIKRISNTGIILLLCTALFYIVLEFIKKL